MAKPAESSGDAEASLQARQRGRMKRENASQLKPEGLGKATKAGSLGVLRIHCQHIYCPELDDISQLFL